MLQEVRKKRNIATGGLQLTSPRAHIQANVRQKFVTWNSPTWTRNNSQAAHKDYQSHCVFLCKVQTLATRSPTAAQFLWISIWFHDPGKPLTSPVLLSETNTLPRWQIFRHIQWGPLYLKQILHHSKTHSLLNRAEKVASHCLMLLPPAYC